MSYPAFHMGLSESEGNEVHMVAFLPVNAAHCNSLQQILVDSVCWPLVYRMSEAKARHNNGPIY